MKTTIQQAIAALTSVYSLKKLKKTMGHEGAGFTADLYKNGIKIGDITDWGDGGGENTQINQTESDALEVHAREFCALMENEPSKYSESTWFIGDLKYHQEICNTAKRSKKSTQVVKFEFDKQMDRNQFVYAKFNAPYSPSIEAHAQKDGYYCFYNQTAATAVLPVQSKAPAKKAPKAAPAGNVVKSATHGDYIIEQLNTKSITVTTSNGAAVSAMKVLKEVATEIGLEFSATTNTRSLGSKIITFLNK